MQKITLSALVVVLGFGLGMGSRFMLVSAQLDQASETAPYQAVSSASSLGGNAGSCN